GRPVFVRAGRNPTGMVFPVYVSDAQVRAVEGVVPGRRVRRHVGSGPGRGHLDTRAVPGPQTWLWEGDQIFHRPGRVCDWLPDRHVTAGVAIVARQWRRTRSWGATVPGLGRSSFHAVFYGRSRGSLAL